MYISTIHKGYLYVSYTVKQNLHFPLSWLLLQRPPAIRNNSQNPALLFFSHPRNTFPFLLFTIGSPLIAIGKCLTKKNSQDSAKTWTAITITRARCTRPSWYLSHSTQKPLCCCTHSWNIYVRGSMQNMLKGRWVLSRDGTNGIKGKIYQCTYILVTVTRLMK